MAKREVSRGAAIGMLAVLFLVCIATCLTPGVMVSHDTQFHVLRIEGLANAIERGEWLPMLFPEAKYNYGYATPLFYGSSFLYIPALLTVAGVDVLLSYEILMALVAAGVIAASYYAGKTIFGSRTVGVFAALLYAGSSYFAVDFVERAAVGELFAFVMLPVVMVGIYRCIFGVHRCNLQLIIGFFVIAVSHNLSLLMVSGMFLLLLVCNVRRLVRQPGRLLSLALGTVTVVLLAAFFLLPIAEQMMNSRFYMEQTLENLPVSLSAVPLESLFVTITENEYGYTPCVGLTMLVVLVLWAVLPKRAGGDDRMVFRNQCVAGGVLFVLLASELMPYYLIEPEANVLQFPWRWFLPATMLLSLAGASLLYEGMRRMSDKRWARPLPVCALCCAACCAQFLSVSIACLHERMNPMPGSHHRMVTSTDGFVEQDELYFHINFNQTDWYNYRDWMPKALYAMDSLSLGGGGDALGYRMVFEGNGMKDSFNWFEAPLIYYYGYRAYDETGAEHTIRPSWRGYVQVKDERVAGELNIRYEKTAVQRIAPIISLVTAAAGAAYVVWYRLSGRRKKEVETP